MELTKLEINGFKSFGDKVSINFDEGITGIVGPNGCGKSNIVDAIRWVLGEQKMKSLRSGKMENVIFNGTKKRKPTQLAEVSLTFNNTKNLALEQNIISDVVLEREIGVAERAAADSLPGLSRNWRRIADRGRIECSLKFGLRTLRKFSVACQPYYSSFYF